MIATYKCTEKPPTSGGFRGDALDFYRYAEEICGGRFLS